jgi:hypothetical protein
MLDRERPLKLSWYSKWAVHAGKPSSMQASPSNAPVAQKRHKGQRSVNESGLSVDVAAVGVVRPLWRCLTQQFIVTVLGLQALQWGVGPMALMLWLECVI